MPLTATTLAKANASRLRVIVGSAGLAAMLVGGATTRALAGQDAPPPTAAMQRAPTCPGCVWSTDAVEDLLREIDATAEEGLEPEDYGAQALRQELAHGSSPALDAAARSAAAAVASDYLFGRVADRAAQGWHIPRPATEVAALDIGLDAAIRGERVRAWLRSLLPSDPRYVALRAALAVSGDRATRELARINLERWRWLPRDLGARHIVVNVPAYQLKVVDAGMPDLTYDVVAGAPGTPTPQIHASARGVVMNPSWNVPPSLQRLRAGGRRGFSDVGGRLVQPPGPRNALGRVKLDMANPWAIYLHDTPAKALFARPIRAYSHGCIRVKDVERLAADLLARDGGGAEQVALATRHWRTTSIAFRQPRQVWIVYFTVEADASGRLVVHDDPYGRDARLDRAMARVDATRKLRSAALQRPTRLRDEAGLPATNV